MPDAKTSMDNAQRTGSSHRQSMSNGTIPLENSFSPGSSAHDEDRTRNALPGGKPTDYNFPNRSSRGSFSNTSPNPWPRTGHTSSEGRRRSHVDSILGEHFTSTKTRAEKTKGQDDNLLKAQLGVGPTVASGSTKLGTFAGVFVPTTLNVLSILMFLRFGFILGQAGVVGMMGMLVVCYLINLVTTMSISAIATNGTVRGGGAYYLISRSLGPEFGGSIAIVFYLGSVLNTGMNAVGLVDCLSNNFGRDSGIWAQWLPEGFWWQYLWSSIVLLFCTSICLAGSGLFTRASNALLLLLSIATLSIPISALVKQPFESRKLGIEYTGLSIATFRGNLLPKLTRGAAGSQLRKKETFQSLFGLLFPATGGIFAGASMSGDLKNPSKSIPKGTLYGLAVTFVAYILVILAIAATTTRASLYRNTNVIQFTNISGVLILLGEFSTTFFSALMGVIGSAKLLQALARDDLLPGLSVFGQGTKRADDPVYAIVFTFMVAMFTTLANINQIASFVTMAYLMTFLVTNLACFLLEIASAPNFRPSFHFFNSWTAALGTILSGATMFFVDGLYASGCVAVLTVVFVIIHYTAPPKAWGEVSQSLIYHQVRKYLLRLRQEHVKFWRPQILLFVNDPRRSYKLIQFCNSLKKGALFVLGHVIISQDFGGAVPEARKQQAAWTKYIDFSKIKAFVNICISPAVEWGARNVVLSAGLGGMRPNIVVMGFYNLSELRSNQPLVDVLSPQPASDVGTSQMPNGTTKRRKRRYSIGERLKAQLPTDTNRAERSVTAQSYVTVLEDLLLRLQINVAIAKGFSELELPSPGASVIEKALSALCLHKEEAEDHTKRYIDLWPIQMSAEISSELGDSMHRMLTTNFDTYTLILQLGCILHTVPAWKSAYKLRIAVFVEYESECYEERARVELLLSSLRIEAEVMVFWLASGALRTYEIVVNGNTEEESSKCDQEIEEALKEEDWWQDIRTVRRGRGQSGAADEAARIQEVLNSRVQRPNPCNMNSNNTSPARSSRSEELHNHEKVSFEPRRRSTLGGLSQLGISLSMRTHRLDPGLIDQDHIGSSDASETDSQGTDSDSSIASSEDLHDSAANENDIHDSDADSDPQSPSTARLMRRGRSASENLKLSAASRRRARRGTPWTMASAFQGWMRSRFPLSPQHEVYEGLATVPTEPPSTSEPLIKFEDADRFAEISPHTEDTPSKSPQQHEYERPESLPSRPPMLRYASMPKFSSKPVPRTRVATDDGPGPSIMFADGQSPPANRAKYSIYAYPFHSDTSRSPSGPRVRSSSQPPADEDTDERGAATGYPSIQSVPLSFNDLPSRAQHLILNELIRQNSAGTAVIFTTLPSPVEGTCQSEEDSVRYLTDLEVLCQGLPPVLLVHSNSLTVTMNL